MKEGLEKLKKAAQDLAKKENPTAKDFGEYDKLARNVDQLADAYLVYKKDPKGDYAQARVKNVQQLRRHLGANLRAMENAYQEMEKKQDDDLQKQMNKEFRKNIREAEIKERGEKYLPITKQAIDKELERGSARKEQLEKYSIFNAREVYAGKNFNPEELKTMKVPGGYSIGRAGGFSVTLMSLAAEGKYTMEQLLDPEQLKHSGDMSRTF